MQYIFDNFIGLETNSYSCGWYKFPPKIRILVQMMMMRASYPNSISAGPTFVMNFETYYWVSKIYFEYLFQIQIFAYLT